MNILSPNKQTKLTNKLISDIKDSLNSYFIEMGIANVPALEVVSQIDKNFIGLRELVSLVNTTVDFTVFPLGLKTKSRKREVAMKRQITAHISRRLGYNIQIVGRGIGLDHATVTNSCKLVDTLLKNNDQEMTFMYEEIYQLINTYNKEKYGKDLSEIIKSRDNS